MTLAAPFPVCRPGLAPAARITAIASGKGGVGKTWLSISLAHALARTGRRVLLFDGDLGLANVDIQLGLMPDQDVGDVLAGRRALADVALRYAAGGFDIIAGRSGSSRLATLPPTRVQQLAQALTGLAGRYDDVLIDLGAGVERTVRALGRAASRLVIVTTDEPTALTDAYAFIKLSQMDRPMDVAAGRAAAAAAAETATETGIVVNMAATRRDGERTYQTLRKACEGFLRLSPPLLGVVRRDAKVREAIRSQCSLLTRFPNADAAADIDAIAAGLAAGIAAAPVVPGGGR